MRIRKRFPSFLSQQEEMEVSSFLAPAEETAREAPEKVHNDWQSIKAISHRLLGCSSYPSTRCTIWPHVREEQSSNNPVSNGETVGEIQSTKKRNGKHPLEQENPSQAMVTEQGHGNTRKKIFDLFSNSQMKGNYSGAAILNTKQTPASSSFRKGDAKGIFLGNSKDGKAQTAMRIGGSAGKKERADGSSRSMKAGSSRHSRANGSCSFKYKDKGMDEEENEDEDEEHYSSGSIKKKAKTRSLTSIYDDIRSRMLSSSKLNEIEYVSNGK